MAAISVSRKDFAQAASQLIMCNRPRGETQAHASLHRLWNYRSGVLVGLSIPAVPSFAAAGERLSVERRTRLLATGRDELAALPYGAMTPDVRLYISRFYGGPGPAADGAKHGRRLTFPMLALLGFDGARSPVPSASGWRCERTAARRSLRSSLSRSRRLARAWRGCSGSDRWRSAGSRPAW
jgi:hypothetical protein